MKLVRTSLLGLMLSAAAVFGADPVLLGLLPPDAKMLSGIQVDQSKASRFGQYVLSQMSIDDPGMKKFIADTGFDPRRDLNEIMIATAGTAEAPQMVVVGRGVFNPAKILTTATAAGAAVTAYNGVQMFSQPGSKADQAIAFLDASTAVLGTTAAVKGAIDRRGAAPKLDQALQNKVRDLSAVNDAWFVSTVPVTDFFSGKMGDANMNQAMGGNLLQAVRSASGGLKFSTEGILVRGEALTRSDQDATALADVIRFIAGLVAQNKDKSQQAQKAATLLDGLKLTTEASTLKLTLSIPEALAEQLFMPQPRKHAPHPGHKTVADAR